MVENIDFFVDLRTHVHSLNPNKSAGQLLSQELLSEMMMRMLTIAVNILKAPVTAQALCKLPCM